jgi:methionyl-tRNA formyltransferase
MNEKNIASIKDIQKVDFVETDSSGADSLRDKAYPKTDLRVVIITQGLSRIVRPIVEQYNIVGIIECAPRKAKQVNDGTLYKIAKKIYFFVKKEIKTLRSFTKSKNIPYYYMDNGSDKLLERWVKNIDPDVIVVHSMSQLLKNNIFDIPKYGTINLHFAFLPKYRGPNSEFWQYYNMEEKSGVTVHYIDENEDTGDIIYQEEFDMPLGIKSPKLLNLAIGKIGVNLLLKTLNNIENLASTSQQKDSPTLRARNIKSNEYAAIVNWKNWDIKRIWHILRGTESWLNAFEQPTGLYKGQRWSIGKFEECSVKNYLPSKVYKENYRYFVACKNGKIFLNVRFNIKNFILSFIK